MGKKTVYKVGKKFQKKKTKPKKEAVNGSKEQSREASQSVQCD